MKSDAAARWTWSPLRAVAGAAALVAVVSGWLQAWLVGLVWPSPPSSMPPVVAEWFYPPLTRGTALKLLLPFSVGALLPMQAALDRYIKKREPFSEHYTARHMIAASFAFGGLTGAVLAGVQGDLVGPCQRLPTLVAWLAEHAHESDTECAALASLPWLHFVFPSAVPLPWYIAAPSAGVLAALLCFALITSATAVGGMYLMLPHCGRTDG